MRSILRARVIRALHLLRTALVLVCSGRLDVIYVTLRRKFASVQLAPIEYLTVDADDISSIAARPLLEGSGSQTNDNADSPLLSVIIPCFNYGRYLEGAIASILNQTFQDLEIIVVEGGSTDGETPEIVRKLQTPKTRVIVHDKPTLVGANRNAGILAAKGRLICCLDADDTLDPTYLEKAAYLLEAHFYDIVSTGINFTGARTGKIDVMESPDLEAMVNGNHITTCAVFRRSLWEQVGGYFDTGKGQDHVAEDWDFWLRCVAAGARVRNITGEHLFNYFVHDRGSLSSSDVRSIAYQRKSIMNRNKVLLTADAMTRSKCNALRRQIRVPEGKLPLSWKRSAGRSLLVVVPFMIIGGAEKLLASVIRYLVNEGWSVTVVSTLPQQGLDDASAWFKEITNEVYLLPRFLHEWEYGSFFHYLIRSRQFDVALLAGSRVFYELLPNLAATYPKMAVVDLLFNTEGHTHSHIEFRPFLTSAIAENPEVISWMKKQGWASEQIHLVESGVDVAAFDTERSHRLVNELALQDDDIVIGFSGRLADEKAPDIFVQLAAALSDEPSLRFIMTGGGPLKDEIETAISKLPISSRFQFLGMVDSTKEYFATYDIFVLPSRIDGRPIALLEALSSGCAVIASSVGGVPALIEGSGAGILCAPADKSSFVDAIRLLISDKVKLASMKRAARARANQLFSVQKMGCDYVNALEAAIEAKRGVSSRSAVGGDIEGQVGA